MPELTWVGKDKVIAHHLDVPYRVLERQYSFDEDGSHAEDNGSPNMIIHGDNLEALKALLPQYEGKVDCIYIDPPYNTGNEGWIYNDNVNDPRIQKWLGEVVGKEGDDLSRHDKWLCMMYPRLRLLAQLLAPSGVIFISIDDNEQANLKLICDEIFGSQNFLASVAVGSNKKGRSDRHYFATAHETMLVYRKTPLTILGGFVPGEHITKRYNRMDSGGRRWREIDLRKTGTNDRREDRPNMFYAFYWSEAEQKLSLDPLPDSVEIFPKKSPEQDGCWRWGKDTSRSRIESLFARYMPAKRQWSVFEKDYLDSRAPVKPTTLWLDKSVNTERGSEQLEAIFGDNELFEYPKPIGLIELILSLVVKKDALILDSFAGSGTTAHAVLKLNNEDGGQRRFILVELGDHAESVTATRVSHAIAGYGTGTNHVEGCGGGYSFFELDAPLLVNGLLNADVDPTRVREFVWYTETRQSEPPMQREDFPFYLGTAQRCAYHFIYEPDRVTTLSGDYVARLTDEVRSDSLVIYADVCTMSAQELTAANVSFKKIPRDITRF